jgi:hypothetical protein
MNASPSEAAATIASPAPNTHRMEIRWASRSDSEPVTSWPSATGSSTSPAALTAACGTR